MRPNWANRGILTAASQLSAQVVFSGMLKEEEGQQMGYLVLSVVPVWYDPSHVSMTPISNSPVSQLRG